ncbi:hypothetical protein CRE_02651 [Caenorhabditis remanei]|uniref:Uncharacterized protein n=1 Tax=Caenorhabditis remanei TaxID=31234 RepID=E3NG16_CAERE|nr:hypothetical protein CRE_02651 [Caenorhabditis remanei]
MTRCFLTAFSKGPRPREFGVAVYADDSHARDGTNEDWNQNRLNKSALILLNLETSTADPTPYFQVLIREIDNPSGNLLDGTPCTPFGFTGFGCNTLLTGGVAWLRHHDYPFGHCIEYAWRNKNLKFKSYYEGCQREYCY